MVLLELIPHRLIGIEFGIFLEQEEHPKLAAMGTDNVTHGLGLMEGGPIHEEYQRLFPVLEQLVEKVDIADIEQGS